MVCNLTIGKPAYAEHDETMTAVRDRATSLRSEALGLAQEDATAFGAVIDAYRLPKETDDEVASRTREIQRALVAAAEVARRPRTSRCRSSTSSRRSCPLGNINVISDGAAAAGAARAAIQTSLLNIDANVASIADPATPRDATSSSRPVTCSDSTRADAIVAAVRARSAG